VFSDNCDVYGTKLTLITPKRSRNWKCWRTSLHSASVGDTARTTRRRRGCRSGGEFHRAVPMKISLKYR
jgi:hypothetical protein